LLSPQIFLDRSQHLVGLLGVLILQVPIKLLLVDLLHLVRFPEFFPLKRVRVDFVDALEEFLVDVKTALLSRLKRLEAYEAEAEQCLLLSTSTVSGDHPCWQLQCLDFTKLLKESSQLSIEVFDGAITRETFEVEVVAGEVSHRLQVLFLESVGAVLALHALHNLQLRGTFSRLCFKLVKVSQSFLCIVTVEVSNEAKGMALFIDLDRDERSKLFEG
jgi:hypothetical protein